MKAVDKRFITAEWGDRRHFFVHVGMPRTQFLKLVWLKSKECHQLNRNVVFMNFNTFAKHDNRNPKVRNEEIEGYILVYNQSAGNSVEKLLGNIKIHCIMNRGWIETPKKNTTKWDYFHKHKDNEMYFANITGRVFETRNPKENELLSY